MLDLAQLASSDNSNFGVFFTTWVARSEMVSSKTLCWIVHLLVFEMNTAARCKLLVVAEKW